MEKENSEMEKEGREREGGFESECEWWLNTREKN